MTQQHQFHGHLHVRAEKYADGTGAGATHLAHKSFRAPLSLSKTYWTGETLLTQVVNPTAGMFVGDKVELRAEVGPGAALTLTTPAASRVFRASRQGQAITEQAFTVEPGGWLEFLPEMFIPHAGSRHAQHTRLEVVPGGGAFTMETLAPGRVASGEVFAFARLEFNAQLHCGADLIYQERNILEPADAPTVHGLRAHFPAAYFTSALFCPGGELTLTPREFQEAVAALTTAGETYTGAALLRDGRSWAIRALTAHSLALHRLLPRIRQLVHQAAGRPLANLRKL